MKAFDELKQEDSSRVADEFIRRWQSSGASERANYQLFLSELCDVIEVARPHPAQADDSQNEYVFERGVKFQNPDGTTTVTETLTVSQTVEKQTTYPQNWPAYNAAQ